MYKESDIPNFTTLFEKYKSLYNGIDQTILKQTNFENSTDLEKLKTQFNFADIKLRLAFAIKEIKLREDYVISKEGDLKLCHLMLYKFNDLWFAYEAFKRLYNIQNGPPDIQSNVVWLGLGTYLSYFNLSEIQSALGRANFELLQKFHSLLKRQCLKNYIKYCISEASGSQKRRLSKIECKIQTDRTIFEFQMTDFLTLAYAIRNNFVHNGESTVTTPDLEYSEKKDLLIILYELIAVLTLRVTQKMIEDRIGEF